MAPTRHSGAGPVIAAQAAIQSHWGPRPVIAAQAAIQSHWGPHLAT